jgi:hypothetical protein
MTTAGRASGPPVAGSQAGRGLMAVTLTGAAAVLVGTFLPWLRSGEVWRNSYAVWRSADHLGVVSGLVLEVVYLTWFLLPVGAGLLVLSHALGRHRVGDVIAVPLAALPAVGAALVLRAPLPSGVGVPVTIVGALLLLGAVVMGHRRRRVASSRAAA